MTRGAYDGITVLDFTQGVAGPHATMLLALHGADVIKIEPPEGDWGRALGELKGVHCAHSVAFNRGKRSIALDLQTREGQDIVRALAARADIVLENFKVGTLKKFGLAYEDLAAIKPDIIYCSVTGFGQTGPRRDQAAYDFMIQAMGGLMSVTGEADGKPGGGPQKVGVPIVDIMTGMYTTIAVLAALARRAETGKGDFIDIAMLDVGVGFLANQAMNFLISGKPPRRNGNAHPNIQPQDVFKARDGFLALAVGNDEQFRKFCEVIGRPELASDERFAANAGRVRNNATLTPILAELLATQDRDHWVERCARAGVPCGPINSVPEAFADPQVKHRNMLVDIPHPVAGSVPQVASPMKLAQAPLSYDRAPPLIGQHTEEILREIGWAAKAPAAE